MRRRSVWDGGGAYKELEVDCAEEEERTRRSRWTVLRRRIRGGVAIAGASEEARGDEEESSKRGLC